MMNTLSWSLAVAAMMVAPALAQTPTVSASLLNLKPTTYTGCYSSPGSLVDQGSYVFQAMGNCQPLCVEQDLPVLAFFNGSSCFCGNEVPDDEYKVSDSKCNVPCVGFPEHKCGGKDAYMFYLDGLPMSSAEPTATTKSTVSASSTTKSAQSTSAEADPTSPNVVASTVYITKPGSTSARIIYTTQVAQQPGPSGPNKTAIAVGVVVGVVALLGVIGGLLFYLRQKKRKELAAEMRRHESVTNFVTRAEKVPSSTSLTDSRLEPAGFARRMSDQSIADNIDYSRRILKVMNPDDSR